MSKFETSAAEEVAQVAMNRPHLVIVGAGGSRAAFPTGERSGRILPVMQDFVEIVPVKEILSDAGIDFTRNFEEVYSDIVADPARTGLRGRVEQAVFTYFSSLKLPETPTLYDHLILSLRPKDVIATFNWDPFLIQAAARNRHITDVPRIAFLHGNVLQGFCQKDTVHGVLGATCSRCKQRFQPVPLLYPVREKNYEGHPAIKSAWGLAKWALENAFMVTVFGYGAPKSDQGAVTMLKSAWGGWQKRKLEQFEFIDIRDEDSLVESWDGFISPEQYHYEVHAAFYDSWIAKHPRRTGEAWWNQYMEAQFIEDNPVPRTDDFDHLWDWYQTLIAAELA